jgi:ADP-ribosylglycohydrolase
MDAERIQGCLFGMALGDALGADTEFLDVAGILKQYPPNGPQELRGNPARVTDDTQMALAVGQALATAPYPYAPETLGQHLIEAFIKWYDDPDNDRAPGVTCLTACENLIGGMRWQDASEISSKGCGANMRVAPVGVLDVDVVSRAAIAQFQAAMTHGHPTGLAAADLTAYVIAYLGNGGLPDELPLRLRRYVETQREVYHEAWLGDLWTRATMMPSASAYMARGWDECLGILDRLDAALVKMDRKSDPCLATGAGWVAEQAFGTALLCFLMYPDDPPAVIRRAAVTSGDSDSIACIAGAFAGVYCGITAWPPDWIERIEYRERIAAMSGALQVQSPRK